MSIFLCPYIMPRFQKKIAIPIDTDISNVYNESMITLDVQHKQKFTTRCRFAILKKVNAGCVHIVKEIEIVL